MIRTLSGIFLTALAAVTMGMSSCSPPRWIHELPQDNIQNRITQNELNGIWIRPVSSPYSIADSSSAVSALEKIEISENHYSKIHLYSEHVHGLKKIEIYSEKGTIALKGPWLLLTPERSEYFVKEDKNTENSAPPELPVPEKYQLKKKKNQKPLLYYIDRDNLILTPLALERMGRIYESGVYEGSTIPFDAESSSFLKAVYIYNNKRYHKHGYIKRR